MENYLQIANGFDIWLAVTPVAIITIIQAVIFAKLAMKAAPAAGLSKEQTVTAFRVGATSALGPALGVFVVMLGLMSAIGGPLAWQRLSIIGAAPTELAAATQAANAMGVEMGGEGYGLVHFANAAWVMALNGSAWLLFTGLFTDKLQIISDKVSGGNVRTIGIVSLSAMLGAFAFLFGQELIKIAKPEVRAYGVAGIVAMVSMMLLDKLADKFPRLSEFNMGIAMIIGMASAVIYNRLVG